MTKKTTDVLIIGGGPGGSTTAISLAGRGFKVTLLEKEHHPRFHIGESLLPANLPLLDKLGVGDQVRAIGMPKYGAQFVSTKHTPGTSMFDFGEAWDKSMPFAYEVRRSQYDEVLLRRAAATGTEVIEGCRVTDVNLDQGTDHPVLVQAVHDDGSTDTWEARYLVDATGRDTFMANRRGIKRRDPLHNSSAMFAHFTGVERLQGREEGNISLFWFEHGWVWFIPLLDGTTSIGTVVWPYYMKTRKKPLTEFFQDTLAMCPPLMERMRNAKRMSEVSATGNYSYKCDTACGKNHILVGDAFAFVDPMFSSGVMLAMRAGEKAADTLETVLREPAKASAALKDFEKLSRHGPKEFSWFIHRSTQPTIIDLFMDPRNYLRMQEAVLSVLAGDIYGRRPMWLSLACFKILHALVNLKHLPRTMAGWRRRKVNIAYVPEGGAPTG
jgi:flavin-dependent dehydrogenase